MQEFTIDYFINKFSAIPEDEWCTGFFVMGERRCAQGHCGMTGEHKKIILTCRAEVVPPFLKEAKSLVDLFGIKNEDVGEYQPIVGLINNGKDPRYQQPTPKQRILAALYDIKKMQDGQEGNKPEPKVKIKYVSVPETIKEQSKEIVLS